LGEPLGEAGAHDLFALGALRLSQSTVAGSVAGGGDLDIVQVVTGMEMPPLHDVIVSGGELKYRNGTVHGIAVYGSTAQLKNVVFTNGGQARLDSVVDFADAAQSLNQVCAVLSTSMSTGTVLVDAAGIHLSGNDPDSNVFHIGVDDVNNALAVSIDVPAGASALIVVDGIGQVTIRRTLISLGSAQPEDVLWAFCESSRVTLDKVVFTGSIVAPAAELRFSVSTITGNAAVAIIDGQGVTVSAPFAGCIKPVPGGPPPGEELPCAHKGNGKKDCP
jgi:choice-of-anchor A domain-containing protein